MERSIEEACSLGAIMGDMALIRGGGVDGSIGAK